MKKCNTATRSYIAYCCKCKKLYRNIMLCTHKECAFLIIFEDKYLEVLNTYFKNTNLINIDSLTPQEMLEVREVIRIGWPPPLSVFFNGNQKIVI